MDRVKELLKKMAEADMIYDYMIPDSDDSGGAEHVAIKLTSQSQFTLLQI